MLDTVNASLRYLILYGAVRIRARQIKVAVKNKARNDEPGSSLSEKRGWKPLARLKSYVGRSDLVTPY